ncbi:MAG: hypothetical protein HQK56_20255, partial [Deltaproteobacteria bacterium]|nr:hypothetical protein [Deltaproteobacteria bacterium]
LVIDEDSRDGSTTLADPLAQAVDGVGVGDAARGDLDEAAAERIG